MPNLVFSIFAVSSLFFLWQDDIQKYSLDMIYIISSPKHLKWYDDDDDDDMNLAVKFIYSWTMFFSSNLF